MRRLNYHHLQYFWVVAKEGHLTRAAEQLHVSQSALSAQIRQLEEQLGRPLFVREGRSLVLTEVGRVVLDYADSIFSLGSELLATIRGGEGGGVQRLRVGAVSTLSRNFQENFLRPVVGIDQVRLLLQSGSIDELLAALAVHKLDLVLSNSAVASDAQQAWRCRRVARQPVCLVGRPRAAGQPFQYPDDLTTVRLLLPGRSSDIRAQFDLLCESLRIEVEPHAEVDDMAMLRLLARDSAGVAVVPSVVVQDELRDGALQQYCVLPKVFENFYAITTRRQFESSALKLLLSGEEPAVL